VYDMLVQLNKLYIAINLSADSLTKIVVQISQRHFLLSSSVELLSESPV